MKLEDQIKDLEPVDLSQPIVTEPVIDEEVYIQPEHIPEDVHKMVFIDEATSVPITEEELIPLEVETPAVEVPTEQIIEQPESEEVISEISQIEEIHEPEVVTHEPEVVIETVTESAEITEVSSDLSLETEDVSVPEPEEVIEMETLETTEISTETVEQPETISGLDVDQIKRRDEIIQQMLAETKEREKKEEFQVRDMGQTEGRAYSAVVFGQESSKNVKRWRQWEKNREKREKKLAKKEARKKQKK